MHCHFYAPIMGDLTVLESDGGVKGVVGALCGFGDSMIEISTSIGSSFGFGITVLEPFLAFGTL